VLPPPESADQLPRTAAELFWSLVLEPEVLPVMNLSRQNVHRRGAIVPLFAILLIPILAMLAFSIDAGYMVLVRTDLQNCADSAALAGAEKLQALYVQYYSPGVLTQSTILAAATGGATDSPRSTAQKFSSLNKAGNVNITLLDGDVKFGFTDANGHFHLHGNNFPNTIDVTVRRDETANTPVGLFFGGVLGMSSVSMTATARATIYSGSVNTLQVIPGVDAHILPVALDYKVWDNFYATGQSPDGTIHTNANNGGPELQVYPTTTNTPGSFGLLDVGPPQNNVPAFRNWIDDGETPNDISYLLNNNLLPVSMDNPKSWKCGPGLKSTLEGDFASQIGSPLLIPIFKAAQYPSAPNVVTGTVSTVTSTITGSGYVAASGNGQGATYNIVGFVGITISSASGSGNGMNISIQPMAVVDPTAVIANLMPAGTQNSPLTPSVNAQTTITTFGSAKLTN
jgi:Flp pilus assembly protein TadG